MKKNTIRVAVKLNMNLLVIAFHCYVLCFVTFDAVSEHVKSCSINSISARTTRYLKTI